MLEKRIYDLFLFGQKRKKSVFFSGKKQKNSGKTKTASPKIFVPVRLCSNVFLESDLPLVSSVRPLELVISESIILCTILVTSNLLPNNIFIAEVNLLSFYNYEWGSSIFV